MATKAKQTTQNEKFSRIARLAGVSVKDVETLAKHTERTFRSVGRAFKLPNGRVEIHARERIPMTFNNKLHVVKSRALVKDAIDCPLAKAYKDPDACWLGAHATNVHVGNATVTFWSELCPHITVKGMLTTALRTAVRDWDEQVKKKQKNRRFRLADGTYFLSPYPPSFDPAIVKRKKRPDGSRGHNILKPTRRLTVRSDISLAVLVPKAKQAQKRAASKRRKAS